MATGILQADAYAGYNRLYELARSPGPVTEAACFAHARRKFYELADIAAGKRRGKRAPLLADLEDWMRAERAGLSRHSPVAKAMDYMGSTKKCGVNRWRRLRPGTGFTGSITRNPAVFHEPMNFDPTELP